MKGNFMLEMAAGMIGLIILAGLIWAYTHGMTEIATELGAAVKAFRSAAGGCS